MIANPGARVSVPGRHRVLHARNARNGASKMLDIVLVALALGFFALSVGYAYACERL